MELKCGCAGLGKWRAGAPSTTRGARVLPFTAENVLLQVNLQPNSKNHIPTQSGIARIMRQGPLKEKKQKLHPLPATATTRKRNESAGCAGKSGDKSPEATTVRQG